jgi:hypothetical protein
MKVPQMPRMWICKTFTPDYRQATAAVAMKRNLPVFKAAGELLAFRSAERYKLALFPLAPMPRSHDCGSKKSLFKGFF